VKSISLLETGLTYGQVHDVHVLTGAHACKGGVSVTSCRWQGRGICPPTSIRAKDVKEPLGRAGLTTAVLNRELNHTSLHL